MNIPKAPVLPNTPSPLFYLKWFIPNLKTGTDTYSHKKYWKKLYNEMSVRARTGLKML